MKSDDTGSDHEDATEEEVNDRVGRFLNILFIYLPWSPVRLRDNVPVSHRLRRLVG